MPGLTRAGIAPPKEAPRAVTKRPGAEVQPITAAQASMAQKWAKKGTMAVARAAYALIAGTGVPKASAGVIAGTVQTAMAEVDAVLSPLYRAANAPAGTSEEVLEPLARLFDVIRSLLPADPAPDDFRAVNLLGTSGAKDPRGAIEKALDRSKLPGGYGSTPVVNKIKMREALDNLLFKNGLDPVEVWEKWGEAAE